MAEQNENGPKGGGADEREVAELRAQAHAMEDQVAAMEEEVAALRRRLADAPKRVRTLEERLLETKGQLQQALSQNERLTYTLREAASTSPRCGRKSTS